MEGIGVGGRILLSGFEANRMKGMTSITLAEGREKWRTVVNRIVNPQFPQNAGKFAISRRTFSFSRRALLHKISYLVCLLIGLFYNLILNYLVVWLINLLCSWIVMSPVIYLSGYFVITRTDPSR